MPVVTRSQSASLKQEAVPLNAKGFPSVGGLTIPPATPVVKKRKVKLVSLVTEAELIELGLNKYSKDPSGKGIFDCLPNEYDQRDRYIRQMGRCARWILLEIFYAKMLLLV